MITRNRQSATLTVMPSLAQCLRIRRSAHASLRRSARVYLHQHTTSFCRFVRELGDQRRPSGVINGLGEHPSRQALDVQVFDDDQSEQNDQRPGNLVREIFSLIAHLSMRSLQLSDRLLSVVTASLATGNLTLRPPELGLRFLVVSGIRDLGPVRQRGEGAQSHVKARLFYRSGQWFRLAFDAQHRVPPSGLSFDRDGLDLAFNRTMQFDPDGADSLQPQFAVIEQFASVAVAGKGDAVVAARAAKSRIARLLAVLDAIKESIESLIDATQHILRAGKIRKPKVALGSNLFQLVGLIAIVDRLVRDAISVASLLNGGVVEAAGFGKLMSERVALRLCRVEPVFEVLSHLSALLILDVFPDGRLGHVTDRADVITATPKSRKSRFQERKLFAQYAGSEALELRRDVRGGQRRIGFHEHVNVIRHDLKRVYFRVEFSRLLVQQLFQTFSHWAAENRLAVFRTKHQVVFESEDRAGVPSITSVNHRKYLNKPLDTLQLNNAEFQEEIDSKTRRCEIPLSAISRQGNFAELMDGRTIIVPLAWYPRLLHATEEQRNNWKISGGGYGIHWPDIDEDLSTEGLLRGAPAPRASMGAD